MTRRDFLAAARAAQLTMQAAAAKPQLCIFSKHMASLNYQDLGKEAKRIGFDGVDLTVREKGHVLPTRAAEDMPRAVEAIREAGLSVPMITTNLVSPSDPTARPILSTAARLKVPYFKPGYSYYRNASVEKTVEQVRTATAGLVELGREYGTEAGYHNHSGSYVGAAIWDTRSMISTMDPRWIGYYFDPAHATIEGGLGGWKISLDLVLPRLKMVALKDFYWEKTGGKWKLTWCPLGEGMVDWQTVFAAFARVKFTGPISLHVEYPTQDEMAAIGRDFEFMKKQTQAAYRI
jgi:sugar phosphate isomerase/epimerase